MKRYFKHTAESQYGTGVVYFEFEGEWATRQIEIYGDRWFTSRHDYHIELGPGLADQPLSEIGLTNSDEISQTEFETFWAESLSR
ncbi:MAG: hypothetical protein IPM21_17300 [Acidobacteria bacterium]|nr:hypothetical protein [Acidobacteriota bacterium]